MYLPHEKSDLQLECKEETPADFDNESSDTSPQPLFSSPLQSPAYIIKKTLAPSTHAKKAFTFDHTLPHTEENERPRSSIILEKQKMDYQESTEPAPQTFYPKTVTSNLSPSSTPKAFHSISQLLKKDEEKPPVQPPPPRQPFYHPKAGNITLVTHQNINISVNPDQKQPIRPSLYNPDHDSNRSHSVVHSLPSQYMSTRIGQPGLLFIPTTTDLNRSYQHSFMPTLSNMNSVSPNGVRYSIADRAEPPNLDPSVSTSHLVAGPLHAAGMRTGERPGEHSYRGSGEHLARIRFDESYIHSSGREVHSEPSTPVSLSPNKKSILKKRVDDGMEQ